MIAFGTTGRAFAATLVWVVAGLGVAISSAFGAAAPQGRVEQMAREDVHAPLERAIGWLLAEQHADGSFGTKAPECVLELGFALDSYYAWQVAAHGLACMALAAAPRTEASDEALLRAVDWLCSTEVPHRGSDWDTDHTWSALYGFVSLVELAADERLVAADRAAAVKTRALEFYEVLGRQQAVSGGWAYYDFPPYLVQPTWGTSFCTALVLPALVEARDLGWPIEQRSIDRALRYLQRCELPGGAYGYSLAPVPSISGVESINRIEGSLGRTQVANWARVRVGDPKITVDVVRRGVEAFFRHRGFLDQVRTRPIPHEGFHQNAGYFYFFGHYYQALAIDLLPASEREFYHARLRPHLVKTQFQSGGASDFLDSKYMITASTSFLALALSAGLAQPDAAPTSPPQENE
ncbi:MAG: hypothetical protein ACI8QZ_002162 [Chlamydiales bacterium]